LFQRNLLRAITIIKIIEHYLFRARRNDMQVGHDEVCPHSVVIIVEDFIEFLRSLDQIVFSCLEAPFQAVNQRSLFLREGVAVSKQIEEFVGSIDSIFQRLLNRADFQETERWLSV